MVGTYLPNNKRQPNAEQEQSDDAPHHLLNVAECHPRMVLPRTASSETPRHEMRCSFGNHPTSEKLIDGFPRDIIITQTDMFRVVCIFSVLYLTELDVSKYMEQQVSCQDKSGAVPLLS